MAVVIKNRWLRGGLDTEMLAIVCRTINSFEVWHLPNPKLDKFLQSLAPSKHEIARKGRGVRHFGFR
jgi:hypothetical protein